MKIRNSSAVIIFLFFINKLFGMQDILFENQKQALLRLASDRTQINEQDILNTIEILKNPTLKVNDDAQLKNVLNTALLKLVQASKGDNSKKLAEILVNAGADPDKEFRVNEVLAIGGNSTYSKTSQSYKTTATWEAQGTVKQYLKKRTKDSSIGL